MLLRSILRREKAIRIGVMGTHPGVGVTHTAVMLCQYLSKYKRFRTAYLELNQNDEISYLHEPMTKEQFQISRITFCRNVALEELIALYNQDYEYYILDLGIDFSQNQEEFLRCDIKILIGSLTEWKRHYTFGCINHKRYLPGFEHWVHLINLGQAKDIKIASSQLGIRIDGIGYEPDPFVLNQYTKKLFEKLLFP